MLRIGSWVVYYKSPHRDTSVHVNVCLHAHLYLLYLCFRLTGAKKENGSKRKGKCWAH